MSGWWPSATSSRADVWRVCGGVRTVRRMGGQAEGFEYVSRADGSVIIMHHGRVATKLRGGRAAQFLAEVESDPQQVMARWTGNYRRGNERMARQHPRNRQ